MDQDHPLLEAFKARMKQAYVEALGVESEQLKLYQSFELALFANVIGFIEAIKESQSKYYFSTEFHPEDNTLYAQFKIVYPGHENQILTVPIEPTPLAYRLKDNWILHFERDSLCASYHLAGDGRKHWEISESLLKSEGKQKLVAYLTDKINYLLYLVKDQIKANDPILHDERKPDMNSRQEEVLENHLGDITELIHSHSKRVWFSANPDDTYSLNVIYVNDPNETPRKEALFAKVDQNGDIIQVDLVSLIGTVTFETHEFDCLPSVITTFIQQEVKRYLNESDAVQAHQDSTQSMAQEEHSLLSHPVVSAIKSFLDKLHGYLKDQAQNDPMARFDQSLRSTLDHFLHRLATDRDPFIHPVKLTHVYTQRQAQVLDFYFNDYHYVVIRSPQETQVYVGADPNEDLDKALLHLTAVSTEVNPLMDAFVYLAQTAQFAYVDGCLKGGQLRQEALGEVMEVTERLTRRIGEIQSLEASQLSLVDINRIKQSLVSLLEDLKRYG